MNGLGPIRIDVPRDASSDTRVSWNGSIEGGRDGYFAKFDVQFVAATLRDAPNESGMTEWRVEWSATCTLVQFDTADPQNGPLMALPMDQTQARIPVEIGFSQTRSGIAGREPNRGLTVGVGLMNVQPDNAALRTNVGLSFTVGSVQPEE